MEQILRNAREDTRPYNVITLSPAAMLGSGPAREDTRPYTRNRNGKGVRRRGDERLSKIASVPCTQGCFTSQLYGLFTTTCGARLLTSSWALTLWICAACSFSCATMVCISLFSWLMLACCSSTFLCSFRNSLSNITFRSL